MATRRRHADATPSLLDVGHEVVPCGYCGRATAADLDHGGAPLNSRNRGYCDRSHRELARNLRRRTSADPAVVAARHLRIALTHRHELEDAGQLELTGLALPPMPATNHATGGTP